MNHFHHHYDLTFAVDSSVENVSKNVFGKTSKYKVYSQFIEKKDNRADVS